MVIDATKKADFFPCCLESVGFAEKVWGNSGEPNRPVPQRAAVLWRPALSSPDP